MENIILYTIDCPKCLILEKKLKEKGISYTVNKNSQDMMKKNISQCPMLEVNDRLLDFNEAVKWIGEKHNGN